MIDIRIQASDFDPGRQLERLQELRAPAVASLLSLIDPGAGAVRIDHYPAMARSELATIAEEAGGRWPLLGVILIFRHGPMSGGERAAFVAVGAQTSATATEACAWLRDALAERAPFWQIETGEKPAAAKGGTVRPPRAGRRPAA